MKLSDLTPDPNNANRGTERGNSALEASLQQYGAGRSILIDKHGNIIAGNKTAEIAGQVGIESVKVVKTAGNELVAVMRTDLDLTSDPEARALAYADNRVGEISLDWDADAMLEDIGSGLDLSAFWSSKELEILLNPQEATFDEDLADGLELRRVFEVDCPDDEAAAFEAQLDSLLKDYPNCKLKKTERV